jgi:hypothetical protein
MFRPTRARLDPGEPFAAWNIVTSNFIRDHHGYEDHVQTAGR